ncbi:ParE toxin of type II toxin-antitoxin system, parDE [Algoriphagus locisalis]|uniref:ParE toxin of type II toxin-antitoxin system, parDE n=1 Tax=Algoriphagus locisalis TaxID=305507 RepID=A0A1I6XSC3_9BACT|nr:type II toxin-antitoxin system RelE/ParE family toxin [Algoriphagus locisalis]SFT41278.1 ParE toxin of type II toxin-antitoxin system, parDE [Algoriphagus locisalis]
MTLRIAHVFKIKLQTQLLFIASDKLSAARKFQKDLLKQIKMIPKHPLKCRKSIFFESENFRDLVFRGYIIVYEIIPESKEILVFGLVNYERGLSS